MAVDHTVLRSTEDDEQQDHLTTTTVTRTQARILSWLPLRYDNLEANGLCLDVWARATVGMASMFLGPALLQLARDAAGCVDSHCTNTIYGFRASSLLTNLATISGILSTIGLPVFGSIIDHTCYRRQVGLYTAWGLIFVKTIEIGVSQSTWFVVVCLQVVSALLFSLHITASYSYISELSHDTTMQANYNSYFFFLMYLSTLIFLILVEGAGWYFHTDDVNTARISQFLTSLTGLVCFPMAWTYLFHDRPALSPVPEHQTLWSAGFYKTFRTVSMIRSKFRGLMWLYIAITFGEAGSGALISVATTYMTEVLAMNGNEIGLVFLVVLLGGIPGSQLGKYLTSHMGNPIICLICCLVFFIVSTAGASVFLKSPEQKPWMYLFGLLWGVAIGWMSPLHMTCLVPILPQDQAAELMGIYVFCTSILSWLPPLFFTILNENGVNMSYGLASLNVFFGLAVASLFKMGSYGVARQLVDHDETIELSATPVI